MRRFNARDIFGIGLILLGFLMLMENMDILKGATGYFWGVIFVGISVYFFNAFFRNRNQGWWNIIPAMVLLGLGISAAMPESLSWLSGAAFLGSLGLAFFVVYFSDRSRWWGIIPGGVMLTLATVSAIEEKWNVDAGGVFFLGLGITFLLVGLLPADGKRNEWGYIPAVALLALGGFMLSNMSMPLLETYLPYLLIGLGLVVLARFMLIKKE